MGKAHEKLLKIRQRLGLTMGEMAKLVGLRSPSAYQYYEDPASYKGDDLSPRIVRGLLTAQAANKLPTSEKELHELLGSTAIQTAVTTRYAEKDTTPFEIPTISAPAIGSGFQVRRFLGELDPLLFTYGEIQQITHNIEDLVALVLEDPNLFPPSTAKDYLLVDTAKRTISEPGLYVFSAPEGLSIYECDKNPADAGDWVLTARTVSELVRPQLILPDTDPIHTWGRAIWHGRSLWNPVTVPENVGRRLIVR